MEFSCIYGKVNATDPRLRQLPDFVVDAIAETHVLAIGTAELPDERDVPRNDSRPELSDLEDGTVLSDLLDQDILSAPEAALEPIGVTLDDLETLQPLLVLQLISRPNAKMRGASGVMPSSMPGSSNWERSPDQGSCYWRRRKNRSRL